MLWFLRLLSHYLATTKVVKTVKAIVDHLPLSAFEEAPPSPPYLSSHDSFDSLSDPHLSIPPAGSREAARSNRVRELVDTERKYVQDLEIMQVCSYVSGVQHPN